MTILIVNENNLFNNSDHNTIIINMAKSNPGVFRQIHDLIRSELATVVNDAVSKIQQILNTLNAFAKKGFENGDLITKYKGIIEFIKKVKIQFNI